MPLPNFPTGAEDERGIFFSSEGVDFELSNEPEVAAWLQNIIEQEGHTLHLLNFIFCPDDYLHRLNVQYLGHDTLTDVITFPYQNPPHIEGDIFISIDRIRENASIFNTTFDHELYRVMVHGVLHLCGYGDKTEEEIKLMREKENQALSVIHWK